MTAPIFYSILVDMIEIRNVETMGFTAALRGMRNPYESFSRADSNSCTPSQRMGCIGCGQQMIDDSCLKSNFAMGMSDSKLAHKLVKGGSEHRKFLRMIHVQADVIAPRRWWSEFDTYRFVEKNSSSTMHLITKRHLTLEDFSYNKFSRAVVLKAIEGCNDLIDIYNDTTDPVLKEAMFMGIKDSLPEGFNQLRTIDTNYEELLNIYRQRKNHRQPEWKEFCQWIRSLPYMGGFIKVYEKGMEDSNKAR